MGHLRSGAKPRFCKDTARVIGIVFSLVVLGWIVHMGYKLTTETREIESGVAEGCSWALVFGAITVGLGLIYFIIGLMIVAELALDVLVWLGKEGSINYKEKEHRTVCQMIIQVTATMASMSMLTWAIYYGYKLASEAQRVVVYNRLAFLIGVITMAFGFIYFIIGIALVADSALHFTDRLQQSVTESDLISDGDLHQSLLV
ncbi:unnamed protein product [Amaranthus hypochondriacus]